MGGSQSTRKITVPNESAHIIKVSDSVIDRLKNIENPSTESPKTSPLPSANINPSPTPAPPSFAGSLTSMQVLQEKEKQLKENDAYWANRVRAVENAQSNNRKLMEEEFSKTVAVLEKKLPKRPSRLSEVPCSDKKAVVLDCFRQNPKQILHCSKEVADFAACVDQKHLSAA